VWVPADNERWEAYWAATGGLRNPLSASPVRAAIDSTRVGRGVPGCPRLGRRPGLASARLTFDRVDLTSTWPVWYSRARVKQ
jgi:hypothetical protein